MNARFVSASKRFAAFSMLLLFACCGVFSTRPPEPPDTSTSFIWTPTTSVDLLLANFVGTVQSLDAANFTRVFVRATDSISAGGPKTYTFNFSPSIDQASKSIFQGWTVESEGGCVSKLKSLLPKGAKLTLLLSNKKIEQSTATATISSDYTLSIPVDASTTVIPSVVTGSFTFQLVTINTDQSTHEWRIQTWSDFPPKASPTNTWTDLKVKVAP